MNKLNTFLLSILFIISITQHIQSQNVYDDFEGNGTINNWYGENCGLNKDLSNPYQQGINTSETVLEYHDTGAQYANIRFDINDTYDLSNLAIFSFKIYVPSSGITGSQTNQVSLKLQNGTLTQPWLTQTSITKPIELNQWQTIKFDFANDNYVNLDQNSSPPIQRKDFNRVLIQVNGEDNFDHVKAYIDDFSYSDSSDIGNDIRLLQSNNHFEFWGLNSEQQAADILITELSDNYDRIADSLNTTLSHKIKVYVYQDLQTYHDAINWSDAPDWVVGNASDDDRIDMVTPYNPGPEHDYDSILLVVTHEMVHNFINYISNGSYIPKWLHEGTAVYLAEQHQNGFCFPINNNNGIIPTLDELNDGNTFGSIGGYQITPTIAEFISQEFGGSRMLSQFIASGIDYSVLGLSGQQEFQDEWNQYVFINYPCNYSGLLAVFDADQISGDYPLTVQFNDYSIDGGNSITSWNWDFDNDGTRDSNAQNPTWTYTEEGTYSVSLTVNNGINSNTYLKNNYVTVSNPQNDQQLLFDKDFEDQSLTSGGWTVVNVSGAQTWFVPETNYGHNNSYCAKINGYDNGAKENENWIISPDFSPDDYDTLNLSFWNATAYNGPKLELYWTNNYSGDPTSSNWTKIENAQWHDGNTIWDWTYSGIIDLSSLTGSSARIGFKYISSVQEGAAGWQLDDIILSTNRDSFDISVSVAPENSGTITGAGTYDANDTVVLTAISNTGYTFKNWTENGNLISTDESYSFSVTSNRTLIANFITDSDFSSYFTNFETFIQKLTELTSSSDYANELNGFWNALIKTENFPFAIDKNVAFLYRGTANSVSWPGEYNAWSANDDPGRRLGVSDIWILEKEFPSDSRISYKIAINNGEWVTDPINPLPLTLEWGNSVLRMPDYQVPPETIVDSTVPTGSFSDNILITSSNLGYTCQYRVYTPAGYDQFSNLPVIYVTDGNSFSNNTFGKMRIVLDNYIHDGTIEPVIAVFLDPRNPSNINYNRRADEYRNNINFVNYVTQELIPVIDANYKTNPISSARAIAGFSYGGYNAAYFLAKASSQIGNNAILSPIIHPNPTTNEVFNAFLVDLNAADFTNSKIYMSYGTFDADEEYYYGVLQNVFNQKGKVFEYDIVNDAHNFYNWNGVIGDALTYFFPSQSLSVSENHSQLDFSMYPNPATEKVYISVQEKAVVSVYTTLGIKVLEKTVIKDDFIDCSEFSKGIYLVLVKSTVGSSTKKLIIR